MKIFILICNFSIPLIMITIGILYKYKQYKNTNKILDLFVPITILFSGISRNNNFSINTNILTKYNRIFSLLWIICGIFTLLFTIIALLFNKSSIILLEIELVIVSILFISIEYILKRNLYKK